MAGGGVGVGEEACELEIWVGDEKGHREWLY